MKIFRFPMLLLLAMAMNVISAGAEKTMNFKTTENPFLSSQQSAAVDFHIYLTDNNKNLKVRINHPTEGKLRLKLTDTSGQVFYESKIDLYHQSVIPINISYLPSGVYVVNLSAAHFSEHKEFILP